MTGPFIACVRVNVLFYRRNQLLLVLGVLSAALAALPLLFSFAMTSATGKLEVIVQVYHGVTGLGRLVVPVMALMSVHQAISGRSLKMVFVKPCPPEVWMASHVASLGLVVGALYLIAALVGSALFIVWEVPFQTGLWALALYEASTSMITVCLLLLLTTFLQPVIAFAAFVLLQDRTFLFLSQALDWAGGSVQSGAAKLLYAGLSGGAKVLYLLLPTSGPYHEELAGLATSLRLESHGTALASAVLYAAVLSAFCWLVSSQVLRKRNIT